MTEVVERPGRRRRPIPLSSGLGLAFASPALTWWAIGPQGRQWPDYEYGPYRASLTLLRVAGFLAVLVAVLAVAGIAATSSRRQEARYGITIWTAACLIAAGAIAAAGWRVATAGGVGANIGAGGAILLGPVTIAGLLAAAVRIERAARGNRLPHSALLTTLAVLTAPALVAVVEGVLVHEKSVSVVLPTEYAAIQIGDQQKQTQEALPSPGSDYDWFFPSTPRGSSCDYYPGSGSREYQICYRDQVVVRKLTSTHPYE